MAEELVSNLPDEIMLDILYREPVKTLMKFKCVNKTWCSIIKDPFFIQKHYKYWSKFRHDNFVAVGYGKNSNIGIVPPGSTEWENTGICLPGAVALELAGGYNAAGLVVLTHKKPSIHFGREFLVMNVATRESKIVQKELVRETYDFVSVGFGYSDKDGDFKLVRIEQNSSGREHSRIDMYSLYKDSWNEIKCSLNLNLLNTTGRLSGNSVFWMSNNGKEITVFSLNSEKFFTIPLPNPSLECRKIGRWGSDSIGVVLYNPVREDDMWSWTISQTGNDCTDKYSFSWKRERSVSIKQYDLMQKGRKTVCNIEFPDHYKSLTKRLWNRVIPCAHILASVESLVPVNRVMDGGKIDFKVDCCMANDTSKVRDKEVRPRGGYAGVQLRKLLMTLIVDYIIPPP